MVKRAASGVYTPVLGSPILVRWDDIRPSDGESCGNEEVLLVRSRGRLGGGGFHGPYESAWISLETNGEINFCDLGGGGMEVLHPPLQVASKSLE
eukprot:CAMPEP_0114544772 /NCGR_PEP_ID=MMETSP0114-20121206/3051_1 /TAXON_ID=31324 /ORGANISM="Goniomonas sp, Strain m" /LENGTH=94 /DNA_ID=CAMNT_0001729167 /DNA_START=264 /DNA_END=548 /DNA_ORIENTATION=-